MADVFKMLGVVGIILSLLAAYVIGSSGGPYSAAVGISYGIGGLLSSLVLLAIGGTLARLDAIVRNTAGTVQAAPPLVDAGAETAPAYRWGAAG